MPASGQSGCLADTHASQDTGALCTLIGYGINSVYGPPTDKNFTPGAATFATRIGSGTQAAQSPSFPGKTVTVSTNSTGAAIASGAAMPLGGNNQSGKACPPGGYVCAVAP